MTLFIVYLVLPLLAQGDATIQAVGTAEAIQRVVERLKVQKISDLNFGEGSPGDPEKTVPPGTGENAENASFLIRGEADRQVVIILPGNSDVEMRHEDGSGQKIKVQNFRSFPENRGQLGKKGELNLYVGARREALGSQLKPGIYSGSFTITVIY